jgi:hypothetical protein
MRRGLARMMAEDLVLAAVFVPLLWLMRADWGPGAPTFSRHWFEAWLLESVLVAVTAALAEWAFRRWVWR